MEPAGTSGDARTSRVAIENKNRMRRSRLYMPGNSPRLMQATDVFRPDCFILDLEDAVAPDQKDAARLLVVAVLETLEFNGRERCVRINPLSTPFGKDDINSFTHKGRPDTIILPKCESGRDVEEAAGLLDDVEKKLGVRPNQRMMIMALLETPLGVQNAYGIATASDRVCALTFGAEDYTASVGGKRTREGDELLFARSQIVAAAKAAGIQALDTIYADIDDSEGLFNECVKASQMGFDGKGAIHPNQVEIIHWAFRPTAEDVEWAKRVVAAVEEARAKGSGVVSLGRKMIDKPVELKARGILERAAK